MNSINLAPKKTLSIEAATPDQREKVAQLMGLLGEKKKIISEIPTLIAEYKQTLRNRNAEPTVDNTTRVAETIKRYFVIIKSGLESIKAASSSEKNQITEGLNDLVAAFSELNTEIGLDIDPELNYIKNLLKEIDSK